MMKRSIVKSLLIKRKISTGICNVSDVLHTKQLVYESFGDPSKVAAPFSTNLPDCI
jgi:hypothetical protein